MVDESQLISNALTKVLKGYSCEVKTAKPAAVTIGEMAAYPYDLCLIDLQLGFSEGLRLMSVIMDTKPAHASHCLDNG